MEKKYNVNYVDEKGNIQGKTFVKSFAKCMAGLVVTLFGANWYLKHLGKMNNQAGYCQGYADAKDIYEVKTDSEADTDNQ